MIVVTRFRPGRGAARADFLDRARTALAALAARPGWRSGRIGRAADHEDLWLMVTEWDGVGDFRRALSAHDVKVAAVPLLSEALDEPTAYEVLVAEGLGSEGLAGPSGRADDTGRGTAAAGPR